MADTLVADYDVVELAQQLIDHAMELLPITAAGIVLGDSKNELHVFATSSQQTRMLELLQLHANAGPCRDSYRTGQPVLVEDLHAEAERWPAFVERADEYDLRAVTALPLRLRTERVGALNLFGDEVGPMTAADVSVGQALADVAAIGILHQRELSQSEAVNQQLQTALTTRLIIEQAKGVLAERGKIDMDRAFSPAPSTCPPDQPSARRSRWRRDRRRGYDGGPWRAALEPARQDSAGGSPIHGMAADT